MIKRSRSYSHRLTPLLFVINFPVPYKLSLKLPAQIRVGELTDLINNLSKYHQVYGSKLKGILCHPKYLCTENDILIDAILQDKSTRNHQFVQILGQKTRILPKEINLWVVYSKYQEQNSRLPSYQLIGRLTGEDDYQQLLVRSQQNGKFYSISRKAKQMLNFNQIQQLLIIRNLLIKWEKQGISICVNIHETFETPKYLNMAVQYVPVRLNFLKITTNQQLQSIISQIARVLHICIKQGVQIQDIQISDLGMTFDNVIVLTNIMKIKVTHNSTIKIQDQQLDLYPTALQKLWQQLMKNCEIDIIEYYFPFYHYLQNNRIITYSDFIKYFKFQVQRPVTGYYQSTKPYSLSQIVVNVKNIDMLTFQEDDRQFCHPYNSPTQVFKFSKPGQLKSHEDQSSELSTIKKPKTPVRNHKKCKGKSKSFITKKKQPKISEFLIQL